ncbi:MAG: DEAD/DEAH box helicase [Chloroflexi bacterium]|nr:DEAD/DEAH box helicase [Chloroflexota bacterium]MBU1746585.1 DEAD/DEAH box helicase [Chloroflexota bacterium]
MVPQPTFDPGTIVTARARLWRVDAQEDIVLTATSIDAGEPEQQRFYLPFEDVQRGHLPGPNPAHLGTIQDQDLFLRAYRLSLIHGSAPLVSLQRSRVIPKDYQLVPVVMALETPRVRMLLADDVGLGKTIEAGLIITELMARQMATRLLVVCPASLREQWREALDYFFHIPARIISARHRREMERQLPAGANPWETFRALVVSVDYAKQPAIKNQILEQAWDVVVVDEAHQVAKPHQSGPDQRVRMDRYELAQALAASDRVRHLLLLTATPHNGYTDSFASLLRMLDVGAVEGPVHQPRIIRSTAQRHVCQRRREDVETWFADDPTKSPFPERDQQEVIVAPSAYEIDAIRAVEAYGERVLTNAAAGTAQHRALAGWTVMHLHKRALSSPESLRRSLRNRRENLLRRLAGATSDDDETGVPLDVARANVLDEDPGERLTDEEAGRRVERIPYGSPEAIQAELDELDQVLTLASRVTPRRDSKLTKLLEVVLPDRLRVYPKVIVFTRYVDTLEYLEQQIRSAGYYADVAVVTITGALNERQRREAFRAFERARRAILLATDAISEGINLQHAAAQVVHYELPWNPNRLEQRNGRVDRFGQRQPVVYVRTLVLDETLDATILKVLVEKAFQIRRDYGFSPPYFGDETNILSLIRDHDIRLGPRQLSFFDEGAGSDGDPIEDPFAPETLERIRGESFYGQTHITLPAVEERLAETAATVGSPAEIQRFVFSGLSRFNCPVTENPDGRVAWRIAITDRHLQTAAVGEVIERATFDPQAALDDPDLVALDLGHPLVRRLVEEVKRQAFLDAQAGRTAYQVTPAVDEVTAVLHVLARTVVGTRPVSLVEELLPVAVPVYGDAIRYGADAQALVHAAPTPEQLPAAHVQEALAALLARPDLDDILEETVRRRLAELRTERERMRHAPRMAEGAGSIPPWLEGIADLTPTSHDLLAVTVLYPALP